MLGYRVFVVVAVGFGICGHVSAGAFEFSVEKVIFDVDTGSDDATALLLATCGQSENNITILGVTCTHGNTRLENVKQNVLIALDVAGRLDIPVYAGHHDSILYTPEGDSYFGCNGMGCAEFANPPNPDDYIQKEHAVDYMIRMAAEFPGEVTVIALGPLTNVAMAIRRDRNFLSNLQHLVIMGASVESLGNIYPGLEFNAYVDPVANYIVFEEADRVNASVVVVSWETVAKYNQITADWRNNVLGTLPGPKIEFLNKAEGVSLSYGDPFWFRADPMAAAVVLNPSFVQTFVDANIQAETCGTLSRGALFVDYLGTTGRNKTSIIQKIDVDAYKNFLVQCLADSVPNSP